MNEDPFSGVPKARVVLRATLWNKSAQKTHHTFWLDKCCQHKNPWRGRGCQIKLQCHFLKNSLYQIISTPTISRNHVHIKKPWLCVLEGWVWTLCTFLHFLFSYPHTSVPSSAAMQRWKKPSSKMKSQCLSWVLWSKTQKYCPSRLTSKAFFSVSVMANREQITLQGFKGCLGTQSCNVNPGYIHCWRALANPARRALVDDLNSRHLKLGFFNTFWALFWYSGTLPSNQSRRLFNASIACSAEGPKGSSWVGAAKWKPSTLIMTESTCSVETIAQSKHRFRTVEVFLEAKSFMNIAVLRSTLAQYSEAVLLPKLLLSLIPSWAKFNSSFADTYPPPLAWNLATKLWERAVFPRRLDPCKNGWYLLSIEGWGQSEVMCFSIANSAACPTIWINRFIILIKTLFPMKVWSSRTLSIDTKR